MSTVLMSTILLGSIYLGEVTTAAKLEKSIIDVLTEGKVRTYDLGGKSSTMEVGEAIAEKMRQNVQPSS